MLDINEEVDKINTECEERLFKAEEEIQAICKKYTVSLDTCNKTLILVDHKYTAGYRTKSVHFTPF